VARFSGVAEDALASGIDGCSAPNYALPLSALARAYARLAGACDGRDGSDEGRAAKTLAEAMTVEPAMVSGEGRNDLALMRAGRGDWVTKIGAEGVQAIGIKSRGWGIALKVVDGAKRGLHPATVAVLDQLGLLGAAQRAELAPWREPVVRNYRGIATGRVLPLVEIDQA
jgi:L-asparaginase II